MTCSASAKRARVLRCNDKNQPFHPAGKKSVGDQVVAELKTKPGFSKYGKGKKGIYTQLKEKTSDALSHAEQLRRNGKATRSVNPATEIDTLIRELQQLAASQV